MGNFLRPVFVAAKVVTKREQLRLKNESKRKPKGDEGDDDKENEATPSKARKSRASRKGSRKGKGKGRGGKVSKTKQGKGNPQNEVEDNKEVQDLMVEVEKSISELQLDDGPTTPIPKVTKKRKSNKEVAKDTALTDGRPKKTKAKKTEDTHEGEPAENNDVSTKVAEPSTGVKPKKSKKRSSPVDSLTHGEVPTSKVPKVSKAGPAEVIPKEPHACPPKPKKGKGAGAKKAKKDVDGEGSKGKAMKRKAENSAPTCAATDCPGSDAPGDHVPQPKPKRRTRQSRPSGADLGTQYPDEPEFNREVQNLLSFQWKSGKEWLGYDDFPKQTFERTGLSCYYNRKRPAIGLRTKMHTTRTNKEYCHYSFNPEETVNVALAMHCALKVVQPSIAADQSELKHWSPENKNAPSNKPLKIQTSNLDIH